MWANSPCCWIFLFIKHKTGFCNLGLVLKTTKMKVFFVFACVNTVMLHFSWFVSTQEAAFLSLRHFLCLKKAEVFYAHLFMCR